jgi:hypothetical protein
MTEKEVQLLGFERRDGSEEPTPYYYYVYKIVGGVNFITSANDEVENGEWPVEFLEANPKIIFTKFEEVQALINLLTKRIKYE